MLPLTWHKRWRWPTAEHAEISLTAVCCGPPTSGVPTVHIRYYAESGHVDHCHPHLSTAIVLPWLLVVFGWRLACQWPLNHWASTSLDVQLPSANFCFMLWQGVLAIPGMDLRLTMHYSAPRVGRNSIDHTNRLDWLCKVWTDRCFCYPTSSPHARPWRVMAGLDPLSSHVLLPYGDM